MKPDIVRAVTLLRASPELSDEAAFAELLARGVEQTLAARLIEFLPMAYVRVIFGTVGPRFAASFRRRLTDGTTQEFPLLSEPIWDAAIAHAHSELHGGVSRNDLLAIAGRSAEFHGINKLLKTGSKLQDIALTPTTLLWPETGPSRDTLPARSDEKQSITLQPYRWGEFQGWLALPCAILTFVLAYVYKYPPHRRMLSWIASIAWLVVWWGLRQKRRYGLIVFYFVVVAGYANFAWNMEHRLARHHMDLFWLLQSQLFWSGMIWSTILYLIPCTLYYPKRWNEFR